jgi:Raf kinase inhibitor-like YbhB/YbcL family protein
MEKPRKTLVVSSPEFVEGGLIPTKFTCKGKGFNPTLVIDRVPDGTESMVLIMEDPDAPKGFFTHWVIFDIQPANSISENSGQGVSGLNSLGEMGYTPPCPPSGLHRYFFHVFALDTGLNLRPGSTRTAVEDAMRPHVLAYGTLMGRFGDAKHLAKEAANKGKATDSGSATEGYHEERTTVDESGAGAWQTDKKVQH